jgi:hypothetical protein
MSVMLLPLVAWSLNYLFEKAEEFFPKNVSYAKVLQLILLLAVIAYPLYISLLFAINPLKAPIADADHGQYVDSWAAGWGIKESVAFFKKQSESQKIFVATEGTFGLLPESLEMYLGNDKNITVKGYWPVDIFPKTTLNYAEKMPAYFVFYQSQHVVIPIDFPLKLVFEVRQGDTNFYYRVYQIIPPNR